MQLFSNFCAEPLHLHGMKQPGTQYFSCGHKVSSLLMMIALVWLTASLPFVYSSQQAVKKEAAKQMASSEEKTKDTGNPLSNTNEEKTESGVNTLSEYLHDTHAFEQHVVTITKYYKCHPSDLYFAFHPELLSPPPEA